jgi:PAS domain S-box-containing protein/putative nucleotidyltransferase with HDIG domain
LLSKTHEHHPDAVLALTRPMHTLLWLNAAARDDLQEGLLRSHASPGLALEILYRQEHATAWLAGIQQAERAGNATFTLTNTQGLPAWRVVIHTLSLETSATSEILLVIAQNLNDPALAGEHVRRSEGMYEALFKGMAEGAVFQDGAGRIIAVNDMALSIEGRTYEEMLGLTSDAPDWDAVRENGEPFPGDLHPAMVTLKTGQPERDVVMGIRRPSGERRWITINSEPVSVGEGENDFVVTTFHDITERLELEKQLQRQLAQLDAALEGTLNAISTMVELRDPYTAGHERLVSEICDLLGTEMSLPLEQRKTLRLAALVHDIGKIAIPAEILTRPRQLTEDEYELVKHHVQFGYDILKEIDFARPIADIVLQHHERMDGSGYPNGNRGEDTRLEARIVAVADVIESMASHRPYRPALGLDAAMQEVLSGSGTRFDSAVVHAARTVYEDGRLIRTLEAASAASR